MFFNMPNEQKAFRLVGPSPYYFLRIRAAEHVRAREYDFFLWIRCDGCIVGNNATLYSLHGKRRVGSSKHLCVRRTSRYYHRNNVIII